MEVKGILERFGVEFEDTDSAWIKVLCPFHADTTPSGTINAKSGRFECRATHCGRKGDVFDFVAGFKRTSRAAIQELCKLTDEEVDADDIVPASMIETWHQALLKNKFALNILSERKGIPIEIVKNRRLGLLNNRITIPIRASDGTVINVRQWSWDSKDADRKVINIKGHGSRRLYPLDALESDTIIITEGELKAIFLEQYGMPAISSTGGASTWSKSWNKFFQDKHVVLIYDIDKAGRKASRDRCRNLFPFATSIKDILLPIDPEEHPTGDVIDFFVKCNQSIFDLRRIIEETPVWTPAPLIAKLEDDEKVYDAGLAQSSKAEYFNKFVSVDCVVSAKDVAPYIVPKSFDVACTKDQERLCAVCPVFQQTEETSIEIGEKDAVILELVNIKNMQQTEILKRIAGIPRRCPICQFVVKETHNIEETRLIPQLKIASDENEHVVRRAFYVGHGIETNAAYRIEARSTPEPNTQYATLLIYDAQSSVDSLSLFKLEDKTRKLLSQFQCESTVEAIEAKLNEIYADLEYNVTNIYQRRDMHLLYDLCYHSVLYIPFQDRIQKGWVEVLVLGDSGQGKSDTITWLMDHYGLGEKVDTKGASVAGLLGGLQETARRWFITWGVITLNDRRLVALEEVKGLSTEVIAKMTDARSSGIVEISKIEKARTNCRCRLIWISNPRSQRQLSTYNYGVEAIKELIGSLEDVRRFDAACIAASGDVPSDVVNARRSEFDSIEHVYTKERCQNLVLWAWSRKAKHIVFEDETVQRILDISSKMGKEFSSVIPLVEVSDQRLKLARLSAALAARVFSCDESGEKLIIRPAHVDVVHRYLDRVYSSKMFGYKDYSKLIKGESTLDNPEVIKRVLKEIPYAQDAVRAMLDANLITINDWMDWSGSSYDEAKNAVGTLVRKRALKRYRTAYVKSPAFLTMLKQLNENGELKVEVPKHVEKEEEDF